MTKETVSAVESLMCASVRRAEVLNGGDLSEVLGLTLADGREIVAKGGPAPRTISGARPAFRAIFITGMPQDPGSTRERNITFGIKMSLQKDLDQGNKGLDQGQKAHPLF